MLLRLFWLVVAVALAPPVWAERVRGQTVYVPVYSHVYHGDRERPFLLAVTVAVRNVDPSASMTLVAAEYYDSNGRMVRQLVRAPQTIAPLASVRLVIPESDVAGGSGASCLVRWQADQPVLPPVVEAVMIGTRASQGISFTTTGRVVEVEQ